jgi:hypothetical protein
MEGVYIYKKVLKEKEKIKTIFFYYNKHLTNYGFKKVQKSSATFVFW